MTAIPTNHLEQLQEQLNHLILQRSSTFGITVAVFPKLTLPLPSLEKRAWFPVSGMYGGFAYWKDTTKQESALIVESWSRVVGGSGQRHLVLPSGVTLIEDDIC